MCNIDYVISKHTQTTYYNITSVIFFRKFNGEFVNYIIIRTLISFLPVFIFLSYLPILLHSPSLSLFPTYVYTFWVNIVQNTPFHENNDEIYEPFDIPPYYVYSEVESKQTNIAGKHIHTHIHIRSQIHTGGIILEHKCKRVHVLSSDAARPFDLTINPKR